MLLVSASVANLSVRPIDSLGNIFATVALFLFAIDVELSQIQFSEENDRHLSTDRL
jgi:hypothetical protein